MQAELRRLFARLRRRSGSAATAAVTAQVDDSPGWETLTQAPGDRPRADVSADLADALEAWRKNPFVRRVVALTRAYAVGSGIAITSADPDIDAFIRDFWHHPKNRVDRRLPTICDQLTRDGELFPVLFTNLVTGMSYLRFKTARQIVRVVTDPDDYETELAYIERTDSPEGRTWYSPNHIITLGRPERPVMLHWTINKPIDATRGESDLTPILPWALRYSEWLKDRVRLNRARTRAGLLDITVSDETAIEARRRQLHRTNPLEAGIYVHGDGETVTLHNLEINADDAEADGRVLRLAIATGANLALHYLGEGEGTNYATAREMGEPTARFFADRQQAIIWMLMDLLTVAYQRYCQVTARPAPQDLKLRVTVAEVARADNAGLAAAARDMANALQVAAAHGWIDAETALTLLLKFAGETLPVEQIRAILAHAKPDERS